ncbi:MAG: hypothetical protein IPK69_09415 [Phycisphaerales bacterium]|nr:MAG: hypothetical protein IPK69_09415 [Phycisphaerales bacterium]
MRPRSVPNVLLMWSIATMAGLAMPGLAQQAFYPRVNVTGWPLLTGHSDTDPNRYAYPFWPSDERFGVVVQVFTNSRVETPPGVYRYYTPGAWH